MPYRDNVVIQKKEKVDNGDFGDEYEWNNIVAIPCRKVNLTTEMMVQYEQIGNSDVQFELQFPYQINLNISDYRIKYLGNIYEIVSPPSNRGGLKQTSRVALRQVE